MKKNVLAVISICVMNSAYGMNGMTDFKTALMSLQARLIDVSSELSKPPVPPRDDQGLLNETPPVPPPYDVEETKVLTVQEQEQLKKVLNELIGDKFVPQEHAKEATTEAFMNDMTYALYQILQGFDYKSGDYIGYPTYSGIFLERFLQDFDKAVALIRVAAPQDKNLKTYEKWRPRLVKAVGKMPNQK